MVPDLDRLRAILEILQLLYYRNKNQHRHARWWGSLCILRRCVFRLCNEVEGQNQTKALERCAMVKDHVLPRCYRCGMCPISHHSVMDLTPLRSFSQLVVDGQFAVLGITLLAEISRIRTQLGSPTVFGSAVEGPASEDLGFPVQRPVPSPSSRTSSERRSSRQTMTVCHALNPPPTRRVVKSRDKRSETALSAIDRIFEWLD